VYDVRVYFRANAVVAALVVSACFVDNGANNSDPATATTAAASSSTGVVDPTTTTSESTTTVHDPTTTTETTGMPPQDGCWDQDVSTWLPGDRLELGEVVNPFLPADGLHLYYLNLPERRPHVSIRAELTDPFLPGTMLAKWLALPEDDVPLSPVVLVNDQLLLLSSMSDIYVSFATPQDPEKFTLPVLLTGTVNTAEHQEGSLTATADAEILIVTRNDGPPLDPLPYTFSFHQFVHTDDPVDPYVGGGDVTPQNPPLNLSVCPALSPDGLRLFYTSNVGDTLDPVDFSTFAIFYTTRTALDAPWAPVTRIPGLTGTDGIVCASSVTADGCQLVYYTSTLFGTEPSKFLARRAP